MYQPCCGIDSESSRLVSAMSQYGEGMYVIELHTGRDVRYVHTCTATLSNQLRQGLVLSFALLSPTDTRPRDPRL